MPIYVYSCPKCEFHLEALEKTGQIIAHRCVKCKENMNKEICTTYARFNGSGFYETDYRKKT